MAVSKRFPADHLGPLVPPPEFLEQLARSPGCVSNEAFDAAIDAVAKQQGDCWVSHVTDGELRRRYGSAAVDPLRELVALRRHTTMLPKVRLPRPVGGGDAPLAIGRPEELLALVAEGARYLQLDGRAYAPLMQRASRDALRVRGIDPDRCIDALLALDRTVLDQLPDDSGVKVAACFHDVEDPASWVFGVDLDEAAAERVLHGLPVHRFVIDCGGCESVQDFAFLRHLPGAAEVTLGLIDVLGDELPAEDTLVRRIDAAGQVIDTDRFALSPRHGLSLLGSGRDPAEAWERQHEVLFLLMDSASRAWGIDF